MTSELSREVQIQILQPVLPPESLRPIDDVEGRAERPRRDRIQRQASHWGMVKLERALTLLLDTDLTLRSTATVPEMAVMERALLKLAWLGRH